MTVHEIAPGIHQLDGANVYTVPSRDGSYQRYFVIEHGGAWHCTCPATVTDCWHVQQAREAARNLIEPEPWWYLSFADHDSFLGGCYVQAATGINAVHEAHRLGINPGGEVLFKGPLNSRIMADHVHPADRNRLLTRDEINP